MGDDRLVVLIHGSPGTPRSWAKVAKELKLLAPGVEVVTPAIPGWGDATPSDVAALSADQIVDQLAEQVAADGRPVLLAAYSAAAMLGVALAARGAWDVTGLALFEPMGLNALELRGPLAEAAIARGCLESYFEASDAGEPDALRVAFDMWYEPGAYDALAEGARTWLRAWSRLNVRDGRAVLAMRWTEEQFRQVAVPTVATFGTAAPRVWELFARSLADVLPDARVRPIPGGTHAVLDTHPAEVASILAGQLG
jgi:pimeloyl-ACP methyl ester carboxylesterase